MAGGPGYSNGLSIDGLTDADINAALTNSGTDYRLTPQGNPQTSGGTDTAGLVSQIVGGVTNRQPDAPPPVFQTSSTQAPSTWQSNPVPQEEQNRNLLGKALGIVGTVYGGGTGAAIGAAGNAVQK
jgi:hypothetical protein